MKMRVFPFAECQLPSTVGGHGGSVAKKESLPDLLSVPAFFSPVGVVALISFCFTENEPKINHVPFYNHCSLESATSDSCK